MHGLNSQGQRLLKPTEVSFVEETGYLVVRLDKGSYGFMDEEVVYQGKTFEPKEELHITIVSSDASEKLRQHLERRHLELERVRGLIAGTDWSFRKLDTFYHVEQEPGVESIIQIVEVPGVKGFFHELSRLVGEDLAFPPTHVTLYTRGDPKGIGLPAQEVFDRLVRRKVDPGELKPGKSGD